MFIHLVNSETGTILPVEADETALKIIDFYCEESPYCYDAVTKWEGGLQEIVVDNDTSNWYCEMEAGVIYGVSNQVAELFLDELNDYSYVTWEPLVGVESCTGELLVEYVLKQENENEEAIAELALSLNNSQVDFLLIFNKFCENFLKWD